jgi:deoxyribose-phosphate aldolase
LNADRERLIDVVTREVMNAMGADQAGQCIDCIGACAAHCVDKARQVKTAGAGRISLEGPGHAGDVPEDLAATIDHTRLKPETLPQEVDALCDEAVEYGFATVCVNPVWVERAAQRLRGSMVDVTAVVGFPLGASAPEVKAFEARRALRDGAREIDMVLNIGALKSGGYDLVQRDISGVVDACRERGAVCKVILETSKLSDEEKVIACRLAQKARAHFVKTSTGFGGGGATVYDIALMREAVGPKMGVKASGGVGDAQAAKAMLEAGATRIGASAGIAIVRGAKGASNNKTRPKGGEGESY